LKKILLSLFILLVAIQFIPLNQVNPKSEESLSLKPPKNIEIILKKACYDCHSNDTIWPSYSKIAPASFFITSHVNDGRKAINFSTYKQMDGEKKDARLKRAVKLIQLDMMPPSSYILLHKDAKLTLEEKKELIKYFESLQKSSK
jgi:hypothetical protein